MATQFLSFNKIRLISLSVAIGFSPLTYAETQNHSQSYSQNSSLEKAVQILDATPFGKQLLARAKKLRIPIEPTLTSKSISKTDIVVTRMIQKDSKKIVSEALNYKIVVRIAQDKEIAFQVLDLAHELSHAISPKKNPFDPELSAAEYIRHGIEGDGGEAKAIGNECVVGKELIQNQNEPQLRGILNEKTVELIKARCQYAWKTENNPSKWVQSFYNLGQHYHQFLKRIKKISEVVAAQSLSPHFSSALAHQPYPLALLEEYVNITEILCKRAKQSNLLRTLETRCRKLENSAE